jgi:hypothetical protein
MNPRIDGAIGPSIRGFMGFGGRDTPGSHDRILAARTVPGSTWLEAHAIDMLDSAYL